MDFVQSVIFGIICALFGAAASWYFSWRYYRKSGSDLDAALRPIAGDSDKMLRATTALARMLEQAGLAKPSFDSDGNLTGVILSATAHAHASSTATAVASFTIKPPPQYDRQHEQPDAEKPDGIDV